MNTYPTRINRRAFKILAVLATLTVSVAFANDATQPAGAATGKVAVKKARFGRGMGPDDSFTVKIAFRGAVKRIRKEESCSALFDTLMFDGLQALGRSRYNRPQSQWEQRQCAPGIAAYTVVGSNRVVVCTHFQRLDRRVQSAVLIHEALHTAGLSEAPLDPEAMTAAEIQFMVEEACGLD
jgi:hypothetical protein